MASSSAQNPYQNSQHQNTRQQNNRQSIAQQAANNPSPFSTEKLKQLLSLDMKDLDLLEKILQEEKSALKSKDSKKIESVSQQKSSLVKQIELRASEKAKLLASSGVNVRPGHVSEAIEKLNDKELTELWKKSIVRLKQCKDQNQVNGTIISHSLSRTNKLMSIVRGQHNTPNLYGQKGKAKGYSQSHILGKA